ncbi:cyclic peptide export ABC transporter [Myxococcus sp. RHSTA-1-4]|uniref:cyclic peptide export ABC transporter n=1 Tax=Myxococcus sp. RHSTA-1-4 TaxID=2874601 RepID=UPI001CC1B079|nr:cyclic peptide export ABC transporter [Myxococcus sp. RHSTA-1-4]MBZ4422341.1 cyclic peptide export ABC transporter [Myxococcus sp. RHSTA-1-4]
MKLLALLFQASRGRFVFAVLCGLLSGACGAGLVALINQVLSRQLPSGTAQLGLFGGLVLVALVSRILAQVFVSQINQDALFEMRLKTSERIVAAPLRQLEESGAHRLLAALTEDLFHLSNAMAMLPRLVINASTVLGCLVYMVWLSEVLLLALVLCLALGIATYRLSTSRALRDYRTAREEQDELIRHFRGLTDGIKELKLHSRRKDDFLARVVATTAERVRHLQKRAATAFAIGSSWGMFLFFAVIGVLLFLLPRLAPVSDAAMVGYTLAVLYLQQPLMGLMEGMPMISRGQVSFIKLQELGLSLEASSESVHGRASLESRPRFSRLELAGVTHSYRREHDDKTFTLGPIDLVLQPGELLFLVGGNGSGKTTLAKLLTGLYVPQHGQVLLDGRPVTTQELEQYRQHFSAVFSDFHLFDRLLGVGSDFSQVRPYLERLQLEHKVRLEGDAFSTTELSQGQRKRLALVAAFLEDRPIYLFDEWAADQDPSFKEVFYRELLPELKRRGKAVVVISHDDRYFDVADRLLHLESGRLLPEGTSPVRRVAS